MTYTQYLTFLENLSFEKDKTKIKLLVLGYEESARRFGAKNEKEKMVGKIYPLSEIVKAKERIYLTTDSGVSLSFHYTDLDVVISPLNEKESEKIPSTQKLNYIREEYSKILE